MLGLWKARMRWACSGEDSCLLGVKVSAGLWADLTSLAVISKTLAFPSHRVDADRVTSHPHAQDHEWCVQPGHDDRSALWAADGGKAVPLFGWTDQYPQPVLSENPGAEEGVSGREKWKELSCQEDRGCACQSGEQRVGLGFSHFRVAEKLFDSGSLHVYFSFTGFLCRLNKLSSSNPQFSFL